MSVFAKAAHCTEVRSASLLSGGFTSMAVINSPEKKLANRTFVHCGGLAFQKSKVAALVLSLKY